MCKGLQIIKLAAWFEQVGELVEPTVSPVLLYDPRYRSLYQLYRELQTESMEIVIDSHYAYQWKRTDQLFEIWGFLKLCRTLINQLGFEGVSGWLFDQEYFGGNLLVPTLLPETAIVLRRDDIQLKLVYNALIPSEQGAENHPIYMLGNFHNRPDGRLDFYQNETYIGTIIIDFKYRPRRGRYAFWNPAPRTASRRPAATNQLIAYRADSASRYLYGSHIDPRQREQIRPVLETWAIYPGYRQIEPETEYDSNHHVRLLQLTPGESNVHLKRELENAIANILRMFELYRGSSPSPVNS